MTSWRDQFENRAEVQKTVASGDSAEGTVGELDEADAGFGLI